MRPRNQAETGEIIHLLSGKKAKVMIPRGPSCSSCGLRDLCKLFGLDHMTLEVDNSLGARPSQRVQVSFVPKNLKYFLLLFLPPQDAFLMVAALGRKLALTVFRYHFSAMLRLIFLALTFTMTRSYNI